MLTNFQIKLLTIIKDSPGIRAKALSHCLWPDSDMHRGNYRSGRGTAIGKAAWLAASSQVSKLVRKGWVDDRDYYNKGYRITTKGRELLAAFDITPQTSL